MNATRLLMIVVGAFIAARLLTKDSHGETLAGRLAGGQPGSSGKSGSSSANSGSSSSAIGASAPASTSVASRELAQIARKMGWSAQDVKDWAAVIARESGGNPNATNPTTTAAYGIGQFFAPAANNQVIPRSLQIAANKEKYYSYGGNPNTVIGQLTAMANYIKQRYGTPAGALAHENSAGSY